MRHLCLAVATLLPAPVLADAYLDSVLSVSAACHEMVQSGAAFDHDRTFPIDPPRVINTDGLRWTRSWQHLDHPIRVLAYGWEDETGTQRSACITHLTGYGTPLPANRVTLLNASLEAFFDQALQSGAFSEDVPPGFRTPATRLIADTRLGHNNCVVLRGYYIEEDGEPGLVYSANHVSHPCTRS